MAETKKNFIYFVLSALAVTVAYYGILEVPFYLDDRSSITHNPNFNNATLGSLFEVYGMRFIGYLTLWLNYLNDQTNASGFHLVNVFIHFTNGILIFTLINKFVCISGAKVDKKLVSLLSLSAALIFLVHPLNSQAVIYTVQRLASLVTLFYLAAVYCYVLGRSSENKVKRNVSLALCLIFATLALFTKQNAVTIPFAILILEIILFKTIPLIPSLMCTLFAICAIFFGFSISGDEGIFHRIDLMTRETMEYSRWDYLLTQASVITIYLQKFFIPINLHLDYGLTLKSFSFFQKVSALTVHSGLIIMALIYSRRLPLICISMLLFYIFHSIESGVIPITDLAFEHRTYLPNFALLFCIVSIAIKLLERSQQRSIKTLSIVAPTFIVVCVFVWLTQERVQEWKEPRVFYTKELERSPDNVRTLHNFAEYLIKEGNLTTDKVKAGVLLDRMYENSNGKLDGVMVNTHLVYLMGTKKYRKAAELGESLLAQPLHPVTSALVRENLGVIFTTLGNYKKAVAYFSASTNFENLKPSSRIAFSFALLKEQKKGRALRVAKSILASDPANSKAKELISLIQSR